LTYGFQIKGVTIHGGAPQVGLENFQTGETKNGARSVMVDAKYIYLYNSSPNQTIKIPRL